MTPDEIIRTIPTTPWAALGKVLSLALNPGQIESMIATGVNIYNRIISEASIRYRAQCVIDELISSPEFGGDQVNAFVDKLVEISSLIDREMRSKTLLVGGKLSDYMLEDYSGDGHSTRHKKVMYMASILKAQLLDAKSNIDFINRHAAVYAYPDLSLPEIAGMNKFLPPDFYFYVDPLLNEDRIKFYSNHMKELIRNKILTAQVAALGDYELAYNRVERIEDPIIKASLQKHIAPAIDGLFTEQTTGIKNQAAINALSNPANFPRTSAGRLALIQQTNMDKYAMDRITGYVNSLADMSVMLNMIKAIDAQLTAHGFPITDYYKDGTIDLQKPAETIYDNLKAHISKSKTVIIEDFIRQRNDLLKRISGYYGNVNLLINPKIESRSVAEYFGIIENETQERMKALESLSLDSAAASYIPANMRAYPTYKIYLVEEDSPQLLAWDDYFDYRGAISINVVADKDAASSVCEIDMANMTGIVTNELDEAGKEVLRFNMIRNGDLQESNTTNTISIKPGLKIIVKMGYGIDYKDLYTVFAGSIVSLTPGDIIHIVAQGFGYELTSTIASNENPEVIGMGHTVQSLGDLVTWAFNRLQGMYHFGRRGPGAGTGATDYNDDMRQSPNWLLLDWFRKKITNIDSNELLSNDPRDDNVYLPYTQLMVLDTFTDGLISTFKRLIPGDFISYTDAIFSDEYFNWTIFEQTAWDLLKEITLMVRDYIIAVLPYNSDKLPWNLNNNERVTVYVGPKWGYYKWTDTYDARDLAYIRSVIGSQREQNTNESVIAKSLSNLGFDKENNPPSIEDIYYTALCCIANSIGRAGKWEECKKDIALRNTTLNTGVALSTTIPLSIHQADATVINTIFTFENELYNKLNTGGRNNPDELLDATVQTIKYEHVFISWGTRILSIPNSLVSELRHAFNTAGIIHRNNISRHIDSKISNDQKAAIVALIKQQLASPTANQNSELTSEVIHQIIAMDNLRRVPILLPYLKGYKPVISVHSINSFEDICDNQVFANADGINNQVTIEFPDEPPHNLSETYSYGAKDLREWTAYVNDSIAPDAIRPYRTYAPNIDPNVGSFFGMQFGPEAADALLNTGFIPADPYTISTDMMSDILTDSDSSNFLANLADAVSPASMTTAFKNAQTVPRFHTYATNLLCQKMEPMYDGFISILGNPRIKPNDIVFINDMISDMYGPVIVRKVVHSMSADEGFVTKIQPGLLTFHRNPHNAAELGEIQYVKSMAMWYGIGAGLKMAAGTIATDVVFNFGHRAFQSAKGAASVGKLSFIKRILPGGPVAIGLYFGIPILSTLYAYQSEQNKQAWIGMNDLFARNSIFMVPIWKDGIPYVAGLDGFSMKDYRIHVADSIFNPDDPARTLESVLPYVGANQR